DDQQARLTLVKEIIDRVNSGASQDDFTPTIDANQATWGMQLVDAGTYEISELITEGWDLIDITCDDSPLIAFRRQSVQLMSYPDKSQAINLDLGEEVTCTLTNQKRANVVVTKYNDSNENGLQDNG